MLKKMRKSKRLRFGVGSLVRHVVEDMRVVIRVDASDVALPYKILGLRDRSISWVSEKDIEEINGTPR
jgi:hypothetical protein